MSLKLFNSLTQKKEIFKPLTQKKVSVYVCGITPYDTTHLGHAFTYTHFDVLLRYLKYLGYQVNYTQNVTDIDDDILKRARELKTDWKKLGEKWTKRYLKDTQALNILPPTSFLKATDSISKIVDIIKDLLQKGFAYESFGNVYFEVSKFPPYGSLSKLSREEMIQISSERGADPKDPHKKDPLDFILWQKSLEDEPSWDSPWSLGRPGWHIECSAMIHKALGPQIDIHGGGADLIFPHHESEIAQSESFSKKSPLSRFWLHTSMLEYKQEKMSKSLGNLVMVRSLLKKYSPNSIRWVLLSHHYKKSWSFKETELKKAQKTLSFISQNLSNNFPENEFKAFMNDDLNTPEVLKLLKASKSQKIFKLMGFIL